MQFTYKDYKKLLSLLKLHGYNPCFYDDYLESERCVIIRHDIDNDIRAALKLAHYEYSNAVKSTYFVLITSNFYNIFSQHSRSLLCEILQYGHQIGLHFDEANYPELKGNMEAICDKIIWECRILEDVIQSPVRVVSMHRPSREALDADLKIPGIINSYSSTFFHEFKYLSDSRRRWREPVEEIIEQEKYDKLHILTHAFWYHENELDLHDTIEKYINSANTERYRYYESNFTDLQSVMREGEVR